MARRPRCRRCGCTAITIRCGPRRWWPACMPRMPRTARARRWWISATTRTTRIGWWAIAMACRSGGLLSRRFLRASGCLRACSIGSIDPSAPKASGFAAVDAVDSVPFVDEAGRNGYRNFLHQYPSRAFAVSDSGAWSWAEGGDNPMSVAIANCQKQSSASLPVVCGGQLRCMGEGVFADGGFWFFVGSWGC